MGRPVFFFFLVVFSFTPAVYGKKLNKISFNHYGEHVKSSVLIVRVKDGRVLYSENSEDLMTPASVSKAFGAAAFLKFFGPEFRFETDFYHSGKREGGEIKGDLVVKGSGDPKLTNEALWKLAADFKHLGIKRIKGDLVIDNSLFKDKHSNQRVMKSSQSSYDAPLSAFAVNFNTFELAVSPGAKVGDKGRIAFYPHPLDVPLRNYLKTGASNSKERIQIRRVQEGGKIFVEVSGVIPFGQELKKFHRSAVDPVQTSGEILRSFLKAEGVEVTGLVKEGLLESYPTSRKILSIKSDTVKSLVTDLMTYSSNFMTDMLLNTLGAWKGSSKAVSTHDEGRRLILELLKQKKILSKGFVLENVSGLSSKNKMSSLHVVNLLLEAAKDFAFFTNFVTCFTSPGAEGSLKSRFKGEESESFKEAIRAKTGTHIDFLVSSIAGYVYQPKHGLLAFSILQNEIKGKPVPNIFNLRKSQELGLASFLSTL